MEVLTHHELVTQGDTRTHWHLASLLRSSDETVLADGGLDLHVAFLLSKRCVKWQNKEGAIAGGICPWSGCCPVVSSLEPIFCLCTGVYHPRL